MEDGYDGELRQDPLDAVLDEKRTQRITVNWSGNDEVTPLKDRCSVVGAKDRLSHTAAGFRHCMRVARTGTSIPKKTVSRKISWSLYRQPTCCKQLYLTHAMEDHLFDIFRRTG